MGPLPNAKKLYFKDTNRYWDDQVIHSNYDQYWKSRNISAHMKNVHCAVLTVGGWFDAEDLVGPRKIFHSIAQLNPETSNKLVLGTLGPRRMGFDMGSRDHLGDVNFSAKNSDFYNEKILLPFFREHLKNAEDPLSRPVPPTRGRLKPAPTSGVATILGRRKALSNASSSMFVPTAGC